MRTLAATVIGYHLSLPSRYRGARVVQATIAASDAVVGGAIFYLADGWDEGPIAL